MAPVACGPDFIGLGAQKAATSWVFACLEDHPDVHVPVKELHFFSRDRNWRHGYEWYEQRFAGRPTGCRAGEFSTSYLSHPETPARIRARYPHVRLVACLRDPIARAYSNFLNDVQAGTEPPTMTFADALYRHPEYVEQGRYDWMVQGFLAEFPEDALLLSWYDDLVDDPASFIAAVYAHVGVDPAHVPAPLHDRVNEARVPRFGRAERAGRKALGAVRRHGGAGAVRVAKRLGAARAATAVNRRPDDLPPPLSPADREVLLDLLAPSIDALEQLTGRDLSDWRT